MGLLFLITTNPTPFTKSIECQHYIGISHSDVVLQSQVIATKAPTYPDFYLPTAMNSKLSEVIYAASNIYN